jgi:hypothetical protein
MVVGGGSGHGLEATSLLNSRDDYGHAGSTRLHHWDREVVDPGLSAESDRWLVDKEWSVGVSLYEMGLAV